MFDRATPLVASTALAFASLTLHPQQPMPGMHHDSGSHDTTAMHAMHDSTAMRAMMTLPLGVSMDRMGSGTTWTPDVVGIPTRHVMAGAWDLMLHGFVFAEYDTQGGPRGEDQLGSLNWGMLMASRPLAGGSLQLRTMLSLDPLTVTGRGYPMLLQTGESYHGAPLHDRQHPHDFWMELGAVYDRALGHEVAVELYAAPSGEPALGPVAFMHRPSAMDDPAAPLGHHWQDATHISFGVVTLGVFGRWWKLEGSAFNGREPNEDRWDFDPIRIDSYSGRITVNPSASWSVSAGYGWLASPEALHPSEGEHRVTGSVQYGRRVRAAGQWATTLIYGANKRSGSALAPSVLVESELVLDDRHTVFGRAELVEKTAEDLVLPTFAPNRRFDVGALSAGYIQELVRGHGMTLGVGARGEINVVPAALESTYGSRTPVGGLVFLRLRPVMRAAHDEGMSMHGEGNQ